MKFKLHWGNSILLFFIAFIGLAIFFIIFSLRYNNDLAYEDYYDRGAHYSEQMEIDYRSKAYTDSILIRQTTDNVVFEYDVLKQHNVDSVSVYFYRGMDKRDDFKVLFTNKTVSPMVSKEYLVKGKYDVRIHWNMNGEAFEIQKTIFIKK